MAADSALVVSASRRTDPVAWFPDDLAERLESIEPGRVHTVVIWTKDPRNMLNHVRLRAALCAQDQIFLHLTVTGLGGSAMEPGVPSPETILPLLPDLVEFCGDPRRIRWRFDPIVVWNSPHGRRSNLSEFKRLAPSFVGCGITSAVTSICTLYPKVTARFRNLSRFTPVEISGADRAAIRKSIGKDAERNGIDLQWCCEPGVNPARCIDGKLLTRLHPENREAPVDLAVGQRQLCGCTRSWDVGWYGQVCRGGCLYCYANPVTRQRVAGVRDK